MKAFLKGFKEFISRGNVMDMAIGVIIGGAFIAIVIFLLIKMINKVSRKKEEEPVAVTTKICPFCKTEISIEASRCPHCTSQLTE